MTKVSGVGFISPNGNSGEDEKGGKTKNDPKKKAPSQDATGKASPKSPASSPKVNVEKALRDTEALRSSVTSQRSRHRAPPNPRLERAFSLDPNRSLLDWGMRLGFREGHRGGRERLLRSDQTSFVTLKDAFSESERGMIDDILENRRAPGAIDRLYDLVQSDPVHARRRAAAFTGRIPYMMPGSFLDPGLTSPYAVLQDLNGDCEHQATLSAGLWTNDDVEGKVVLSKSAGLGHAHAVGQKRGAQGILGGNDYQNLINYSADDIVRYMAKVDRYAWSFKVSETVDSLYESPAYTGYYETDLLRVARDVVTWGYDLGRRWESSLDGGVNVSHLGQTAWVSLDEEVALSFRSFNASTAALEDAFSLGAHFGVRDRNVSGRMGIALSHLPETGFTNVGSHTRFVRQPLTMLTLGGEFEGLAFDYATDDGTWRVNMGVSGSVFFGLAYNHESGQFDRDTLGGTTDLRVNLNPAMVWDPDEGGSQFDARFKIGYRNFLGLQQIVGYAMSADSGFFRDFPLNHGFEVNAAVDIEDLGRVSLGYFDSIESNTNLLAQSDQAAGSFEFDVGGGLRGVTGYNRDLESGRERIQAGLALGGVYATYQHDDIAGSGFYIGSSLRRTTDAIGSIFE